MALVGVLAVQAAPARAQDPVPPPRADQAEVAAPGVRVSRVDVRGNQRISADHVRSTAGLAAGTEVGAVEIQSAIRRLMATGNFQNVEVLSEGAAGRDVVLIVEVAERPYIAQIDFQGLERINPKIVRDTVGLQANQPLAPNRVARAQQMIRDLLAQQGVQVVSVDTTLTPLAQPAGSYRLTFRVEEGQRVSIADVDFLGNQAFSDETLRDAIKTSEEGFFWFRSGSYDPEVLQADLRTRLPAFYGERGYIDFAVVSDSLVVDPQTGKARLLIGVTEGPQYRLGEFEVQGNSRFPTEQLRQIFTAQRRTVLGLPFGIGGTREAGEVFDRVALRQATDRVQQMYRNEGYLYAQVEPVITRMPADSAGAAPTVDVNWAISERSPFYISKISIAGNTYTHESVIRNRIFVFPGDVYNEERLIRSYQSISSLGFFETPVPTPDILPNPDSGTVDIVFHVKEKQTGNINFGTAVGGAGGGLSGFLGYSQPNLFGQAKQADLRVEYGIGRNSFQGSYTDPALFGTRNSGSVSLFHYNDRFLRSAFDGRVVRTGASVRYGFPLPNLRYTNAYVGYSLSRSQLTADNDEQCAAGSISLFCRPDALASTLSFGAVRDTRDSPLFPTLGTRQSAGLGQTGGPLAGDGNFRKLTSETEWWVPVGRFGGSQPGSRPIRTTLGLQVRTGAVFGDASRFPLERFFMGGVQTGQQLRGYKEGTITPLGYIPDIRIQRLPDEVRLGSAFVSLTGEYAIRFNDNLSVSLFGDAGNIWSDVGSIDPTRLFRGAGIGATIVTPFGPLGLDYAYGFDRRGIGQEPGWQFHFRFGQGF